MKREKRGKHIDFKLEYKLPARAANGSPFKNALSWPMLCRITLDDVILSIKVFGGVSEYQVPGYLFDPNDIVLLIEKIVNDEEAYFKLGDGKHIPLKFFPKENNKVEISVAKDSLNTKIIGFDHEKLKPITVDKTKVIKEFSSLLNSIFSDLEKYQELDLLKSLKSD